MRVPPALGLLLLAPLASAGNADALLSRLVAAAPGVNPEAVALALQSVRCATGQAAEQAARRLAVIDYSKPSTEQRLWVFDLQRQSVLYVEHVAHGQASGGNLATNFSNRPGSHQTSLGLYRTAATYRGANGYSLRLEGLEPGFNDRAQERAIVMHGAPYVSEAVIKAQGRLGRSHGCPAVRQAVAVPLIDSLKDGQYVFAYYPDEQWLHGLLRSCPAVRAAGPMMAAIAPASARD
ncbi:MAG: murein L,D-transpeptidase catalytic domain family protein [Steroidobacteraceae bacterium]